MTGPATDQPLGESPRNSDPGAPTAFSRIIGIDFATKEPGRGMVLALKETRGVRLARVWNRHDPFLDVVARWVDEDREATLIAVDAPLGWPAPLTAALESHRAGGAIRTPADHMFRRRTDDFVREAIGKRPLEVGADLIARTAHAALDFLDQLGKKLGTAIPLAWSPNDEGGPAAIEVYPAATLKAHEMRHTGYKKASQGDERSEMVKALRRRWMAIPDSCASELRKNADTLDAAICAFAAGDFIAGRAEDPEDEDLARREGWIWVLSGREQRRYRMKDFRYGNPHDPDPYAGRSWDEIRDIIYEGR